MDALNWIAQYMLLGMGIGFCLVVGLLFVGGNPGMLLVHKYAVVGLILWLFFWPLMIVAFILLSIIAFASSDD